MRELAAQAVLLARSFEEADPGGVLLSAEDRQAATETARAAGGSVEFQAERRAEVLLAQVERQVRAVSRARSFTRVSLRWAMPVVVVAFGVGLGTNALGPTQRINLLSFPLLGLLAWNVGVYTVLVIGAISAFGRARAGGGDAGRAAGGPPPATTDGAESRERGFLAQIVWWLGEIALERVRVRDSRRAEVVTHALAAYWSQWPRYVSALSVTRLRALFHLGAAALAAGVIGGMYVRGLGLAYRATWESTFLSADVVAAILRFVLGPASSVLGLSLPDASGLAAMVAPDGSAPAAPWIHLWAVTTAAVVIVPRSILAVWASVHAAGRAREVAVDPLGGPFRALLRPDRGSDVRVEVHPYSYRPGGRQLELVRELLHDLFGLGARIDVRPPVAYGGDARPAEGEPTCVVVLFGLVQLPEREVHARYMEEWMSRGGGTRVLAIVDAASWRERFPGGDEQRQVDRYRAWDRVFREVGLRALHVDLGRALPPGTIERAEAAMWPDATTGGR